MSVSYIIWICPDCGEQITESEYSPERGRYYGHYHDRPKDWEQAEDPWFDAVSREVVPVQEAWPA